jgi:hypothetical protein
MRNLGGTAAVALHIYIVGAVLEGRRIIAYTPNSAIFGVMEALLFLLGIFAIATHARAPIVGSTNSKALLDNYIVVLKPSVSDETFKSHLERANAIVQIANNDLAHSAFKLGAFKGYVIKASDGEISELAESDDVRARPFLLAQEKHTYVLTCPRCLTSKRIRLYPFRQPQRLAYLEQCKATHLGIWPVSRIGQMALQTTCTSKRLERTSTSSIRVSVFPISSSGAAQSSVTTQ